jgi:hypothetical protein
LFSSNASDLIALCRRFHVCFQELVETFSWEAGSCLAWLDVEVAWYLCCLPALRLRNKTWRPGAHIH